jgi:glycosyltransferase involved in cell wall biosynthesis
VNTQRKYTILHLINSFEVGGAEKLLLEFAGRFAEDNVTLILCYLKGPGTLLQDRTIPWKVFDLSSNGRFSPIAIWRLVKIIRREKVNMIHVHDAQSGLIARILRKWGAVHCIVATRHMPVLKGNYPLLYRREDEALSKYSFVIANSCSVRNYLLQHRLVNEDRCRVVYNGIDIDRFTNGSRKQERSSIVIGTVARLHYYKGIDILIEAFKTLNELIPDAELHIIGDGPERPMLEKMSERLMLNDRITFHGSVKKTEDIVTFLSNLDIFVLPSRIEGFGLSLIEAMAMKVAVIGSAVDGIQEIIDDTKTGLLFITEDASDLSKKIALLAGDPALRKRLADAGYTKTVEEYSIRKTIDSTASIYREVLRVVP